MKKRINVADSFTNDFGNAETIFLRASCGCGHDTCSHTLEVSYEDLDGYFNDLVGVNIYGKMWYREYHSQENFFKRLWYRIRDGIKLIFGGYIEMHYDFTFQGEEQINDYIEALQETVEKIKESKEEYEKRNSAQAE